ncbi:Hypothetical protein A7982_11356 [Minicystis rosea]|nr:Hypothetical protein A7982_11356 [Minicystis rosea]
MASKNMVFSVLPVVNGAPLVVVLIGKAGPTNGEWDLYLGAIRKLGSLDDMRTLVMTDGGGPDSVQRKTLIDFMKGRPSLTCMVSSNPIVRGLTTALSWFNPQIKSFASDRVDEALHYLHVPPESSSMVWHEIKRLREQLEDLPLRKVAGA